MLHIQVSLMPSMVDATAVGQRQSVDPTCTKHHAQSKKIMAMTLRRFVDTPRSGTCKNVNIGKKIEKMKRKRGEIG